MSGLGRYLSTPERKYYQERQLWASGLQAQDVMESPFLYASRQVVTEALTRYELFKRVLDIPGAVVECGVHRGNNLLLFSQLSAVLEPCAINRRIFGFDTFSGFGKVAASKENNIQDNDFADTSIDNIKTAISLFDLNRTAGHMQKTSLICGDALETIPHFVDTHPEVTIALLYLDFDLYEPTKCALSYLLPLVSRGGIVAFDEFNYEKFPGPTRAFKEVFPIEETQLQKFAFDPFVSYIVR